MNAHLRREQFFAPGLMFRIGGLPCPNTGERSAFADSRYAASFEEVPN